MITDGSIISIKKSDNKLTIIHFYGSPVYKSSQNHVLVYRSINTLYFNNNNSITNCVHCNALVKFVSLTVENIRFNARGYIYAYFIHKGYSLLLI